MNRRPIISPLASAVMNHLPTADVLLRLRSHCPARMSFLIFVPQYVSVGVQPLPKCISRLSLFYIMTVSSNYCFGCLTADVKVTGSDLFFSSLLISSNARLKRKVVFHVGISGYLK